MTTVHYRNSYGLFMNVLILCPVVLGFGTTIVQAECTNPVLFQELSQISVHSMDSRLNENRDLIRECMREEWHSHHQSAQQALSELRVRESVLETEPHSHDRIHHHGQPMDAAERFNAVSDVFPPQLVGIENIHLDHSGAHMARMANAQATGETIALQSGDVQTALGNRYMYIGHEPLSVKEDRDNQHVRLTYFSYTNNETIEVVMDQEAVVAIHPIAPDIYQPPLTETEMAEAIRIARDTLRADGNTQVAELEGHTILALPTDGNSAFFTNRMGYVSFHHNVNVGPEYVAWVDLTDQVVVESRED